jgi:MFS family permease
LSIEQQAVAIVPNKRRTNAFAWYNLVGSFATALGALSAGGLMQLLQNFGAPPLHSSRAVLIGYAITGVALLLLFTAITCGRNQFEHALQLYSFRVGWQSVEDQEIASAPFCEVPKSGTKSACSQ